LIWSARSTSFKVQAPLSAFLGFPSNFLSTNRAFIGAALRAIA
jgi:hypothetical protein